jgi:hypothetical protein
VGSFPQDKGCLPIVGNTRVKNDLEVKGFPPTGCWLEICPGYMGCPPVKGWLMDICWPKPISWIPWGGNPPDDGCFPKRLGSPPKNNGVKGFILKGFPSYGAFSVKGYGWGRILKVVVIQWWGNSTYDTYVNC